MRVLSPAAALVMLLVLGACASTGPATEGPDLKRLYSLEESSAEQPPVIVIHGVLGARLADSDGREEWPGGLFKLIFDDYSALRLGIDPETLQPTASGLRVSGITDKAAGRDFYGRIIEVLEEVAGFTRGEPGTPVERGERRYYVFAYDWRRDNVYTARQLDRLVEQVRADYGQPDLKVDIIAHSMGGLVTRYYVRYGITDVVDDNDFPINNHGADRVRRVVLLGTPNLGSVKAAYILAHGAKVGLKAIPPEVLATFPSSYQLLPHPIKECLITPAGTTLDSDRFDLFETEFWRSRQIGIFHPEVEARVIRKSPSPEEGERYLATLQEYFRRHIERARRFVWSLTVPVPEPKVRFIVFGGDCQLTPARVLLAEQGGETVFLIDPEEIRAPQPDVDYGSIMLEPGDGVVTKASLQARVAIDPTVERHRYSFFPMRYVFFLCEKHDQLTGNINFQDNLLHAILSVDPR